MSSMQASRNGALDIGRLFWCYLIVQFHYGSTARTIAYSALPAFISVSIYFALQSRSKKSLISGINYRSKRLLIPWIGWSAIYMLANLYHTESFHPSMVLYGTSLHLWFLPFIFIMFAFVDVMRRVMRRAGIESELAQVLWGTIVFMGLYIAACYAPTEVPYRQWKFGILSVALGWCVGIGQSGFRVQFICRLAAGVIPAILIATLMDETRTDILAQLLGLAMVLVAVFIRTPENWISKLGKNYALYVYLAHIFVGMIVYKFLGTRGDGTALFIFVGSLVSGIIISFGLSKISRLNTVSIRNGLGL